MISIPGQLGSTSAGFSRRLEAAQDLAWALLNSPAFLFNR